MRAHPKVSIPTGRPSSIQEPTSSSASHPVLILQQNRNTTLNINRQSAQSHAKPIDTPKLTTGHSREKRSSSIHQDTDTSSPKPRNFHKPLVQPHPQEQTPQLRGTMTTSLQKGDPKHRKLNKTKGREISSCWGNMIKNPPNHTRGGDRESTWKRIQNDSYDSKSCKQISNCVKYASLSVRLQRGAWKWAGADALFRETACCAGFGTTVNYIQQWTRQSRGKTDPRSGNT